MVNLICSHVLPSLDQINVVDFSSKWTPLMRCCAMSGNVEVARELFFAGAEVEKKDKDGKTALMVSTCKQTSPLLHIPYIIQNAGDHFLHGTMDDMDFCPFACMSY